MIGQKVLLPVRSSISRQTDDTAENLFRCITKVIVGGVAE